MRVSVVTITYRPGYMDSCIAALKAQTMKDLEWVLVDELVSLRKGPVRDMIHDAFPVTHVLPKVVSHYSATGAAVNTGIAHCQGELVIFMADYMYLHPRTVERHWEIYRNHGPKVIISARLLDRFTANGRSIVLGDPAVSYTVQVGNVFTTYPEHSPPIEWPLKPDCRTPSTDNLISIFEKPFIPTWPVHRLLDWRASESSHRPVGAALYENLSQEHIWWYGGRADSAPLAALRAVGGMDEVPGQHGGLEVGLCRRLQNWGCRHLIDWECPCYMLPHPSRKQETGWRGFSE